MQKKRKSLVFERALRICDRLETCLGKSTWIKKRLTGDYDRLTVALRSEIGLPWKKALDKAPEGKRSRPTHRWMLAVEESQIIRAFQWLRGAFLSTSVANLAAFFFLGGVFHGILRSLLGRSFWDLGFWITTLLSIAAFPPLFERRPLRVCLEESLLLRGFVPSGSDPLWKNTEEDRRGIGVLVLLLFAALYGGIWIWPSAWKLGMGIGGAFLGIRLLSSPEAVMLLLLALLPVLELFAHKTLAFFILAVLLLLSWALKMLLGRRSLLFSAPEVFVLCLGIAYFLGGISYTGAWSSFATGATKAALIMLYFPACAFFSNSLWRRRGIIALQISGLAVSLLGILQYVLRKAPLQWVDEARFANIGGRVTSCFSNPNVLAVYLLLLTPIALSQALRGDEKPACRALFGICFAAHGICLVLTWSRGAWIGFFLASLVFLLLCKRESRASLLLILPLFLLLVPLLPNAILGRLVSIGNLAESSIRYRRYLWQGSMRMLLEQPWGIGVGETAFRRIYPTYAVSGIEGAPHTHQILLQLVSETGVLGGVVFLFLLSLLFLLLCKGLQTSHRGEYVDGLGAFCAVLGSVVMGFFDHIWYHNGLLGLFWIIFAMSRVTVGGEEEYGALD